MNDHANATWRSIAGLWRRAADACDLLAEAAEHAGDTPKATAYRRRRRTIIKQADALEEQRGTHVKARNEVIKAMAAIHQMRDKMREYRISLTNRYATVSGLDGMLQETEDETHAEHLWLLAEVEEMATPPVEKETENETNP